MNLRPPLCALLSVTLGCNPAVLTGSPPPVIPPRLPPPVTVVIEPFFDTSGWKVESQMQVVPMLPPAGMSVSAGSPYYGSPYGPYGMYPTDVTVVTEVAVKNVYNRVDVMASEYLQVLGAVARLRPAWRVQTTSALQSLSGPVTLVRVVVGESAVVESDRSYKTTAFVFGVIIWPLLLLQIGGVDETQRVYGLLTRYDSEATLLRSRLLRYPTQPDFAVDTRGLPGKLQPFGLDLSYNEGVNASSTARDSVLVQGFVQRLATAVVGVVEGAPPGGPGS